MLPINCEINLTLNWSEKCFEAAGAVTNQVPTFAITNTKLHVPVVTLSNQNYYNNWNHFLKEEITGTNINQK